MRKRLRKKLAKKARAWTKVDLRETRLFNVISNGELSTAKFVAVECQAVEVSPRCYFRGERLLAAASPDLFLNPKKT